MSILNQIIAQVGSHDWMALAILVFGLIQTWIGAASAFPINVPEKWKPVVTVVLGQAYAVLLIVQAHQAWQMAIVHGLTTSVVVLLTSHAIWAADTAPNWVKWLALLLQNSSSYDKAKAAGGQLPIDKNNVG